MVIISELTLPGTKDRIPIVQLKAVACVRWLNPKRLEKGLKEYPIDNCPERPNVEALRNEIIEILLSQQNQILSRNQAIDLEKRKLLNKQTMKKRQYLKWFLNQERIKKLSTNQISTDLWTASYYGRIFEVQQYISNGLSIDTYQYEYPKQTALHCACVGGQLKMVDFLLLNGANVTALDENGNSPIHLAARWGHVFILEFILKKYPDLKMDTCRNKNNQTARQLAKQYQHLQAMNCFNE